MLPQPMLPIWCWQVQGLIEPAACGEVAWAVIKWVENPCAHSRVKHIDVPLKALRQSWTEDQEIDIIFIETHKQLGDALTKTLTPTKHWGLFKSLMNLPIPMQA